jgi:hypothetical protein
VSPIVNKGLTVAAQYRDDAGDTSVTLVNFKGLEIDCAATIERVVDPASADGFAPTQPWPEVGPGITLTFADTSAISPSIWAGFYSGRGFISLVITWDLGASRTIVITIPRIQYIPSREGVGGTRMFAFEGKAVRSTFGDTTAPITIAWKYT